MSDLGKVARPSVAVVGAAAIMALSAQVSVSVWGSQVPQSLQTLAVLVVAALLGVRRGPFSVLLYLALGAVGLPVFADGASGARHLVGPTSGYLFGFVCAAIFVGYGVARRPNRLLELIALMAAAHLIILVLGWARLAFALGPADALNRGVTPFVWGGVVKSIAAAAIVWLYRKVTAKN